MNKHYIKVMRVGENKWFYISGLNQHHFRISEKKEDAIGISDNWIEIALALVKSKYFNGELSKFHCTKKI